MDLAVIGRVTHISPKLFIARTTGITNMKRVITLHDDYNSDIIIDLWDEKSEENKEVKVLS